MLLLVALYLCALTADAAAASSVRPVLPAWAAHGANASGAAAGDAGAVGAAPVGAASGAPNFCHALGHLLPPKCAWTDGACTGMKCTLSIGRCVVDW